MNINKVCIVCSKPFAISVEYPSQIARTRSTCSRKCRYTIVSNARSKPNSKKIFSCKMCGEEFSDYKTASRIFCSQKCKADWQSKYLKGENSPHWKPLSSRIPANKTVRKHLLSKRHTCEKCGSFKNLQIHHIDGNRSNNSEDNLLVVCQKCHAELHHEQGELKIAQLILVHPQSNGRKVRPPKKCEWCRKEFYPYRDDLRFCSTTCSVRSRYNSPSFERECLYCKKTFTRKKRRQKYCSPNCSYAAKSYKWKLG